MDLEEAAGVGDLDAVRRYVAADGMLQGGATRAQLESGFMYACGYGHAEVATYLLDAGVDANVTNRDGQTALHWTVYGPHLDIARLLLSRGARRETRDRQGATARDWVMRMAEHRSAPAERERAEELIALLG